MEKVRITPFRPVYPSPAALITSVDEDGKPNIVTLGECFNISIARPVIVGIAIRTATYSHGLIRRRGEFTVNLPGPDLLAQVDGIGSVSGRDCDKFQHFGLTPLPAQMVAPPLIAECPLNIECKVLAEHEVGDHQLFLGGVLVQHVDADKVDDNGKVDAAKLEMLIYAANNYFASGRRLGTHGFSRR